MKVTQYAFCDFFRDCLNIPSWIFFDGIHIADLHTIQLVLCCAKVAALLKTDTNLSFPSSTSTDVCSLAMAGSEALE